MARSAHKVTVLSILAENNETFYMKISISTPKSVKKNQRHEDKFTKKTKCFRLIAICFVLGENLSKIQYNSWPELKKNATQLSYKKSFEKNFL